MSAEEIVIKHHTSIYLRSSAFICGCTFVLAGCEMTRETESSTRQRQREALNDPFSYGPKPSDMKPDDVDPTDVTGGGTSNLNKNALKRDWDAVLGNK